MDDETRAARGYPSGMPSSRKNAASWAGGGGEIFHIRSCGRVVHEVYGMIRSTGCDIMRTSALDR